MTPQKSPKLPEIDAAPSTGLARRDAPKRFSFTKKRLDALRTPTNDQRVYYHDLGTRGLTVAVSPGGRKTFVLYRWYQGRPERKNIGAYPDLSIEQARGEAARLNGEIAGGKNPFERHQGELTFDGLLTDYCERGLGLSKKCKNPVRAAEEAKWQVNKYMASWRTRKLGQIRRKDVIDLHQQLRKDSGLYTANKVLQQIRAMYNFAIHPDSGLWKGVNPAAKIGLFREEKRKRFLSAQELSRLFTALKAPETSADLRDYVNLALWCGVRKSGVLTMRWSDVNLEDNRWDVPDSKSGAYAVPLVPEAITILKNRLRARADDDDSEWVFPSERRDGPLRDLKKAWKKLLQKANIEGLRQHDLRRTLASWQAKQGTSLLLIAKSLGHTSVDATEVYARLDTSAVRDSMATATRAMVLASKKKPKQDKTKLLTNG